MPQAGMSTGRVFTPLPSGQMLQIICLLPPNLSQVGIQFPNYTFIDKNTGSILIRRRGFPSPIW